MFCQLFSLFLLFGSFVNTLEVKIQGIEEPQGMIRIAVYDSDEVHLDEEQISFFHEEPVNATGEMTIRIQLPEGSYSVAVFHDVNGDKALNKNMIGMPKEPYGFSNNAMGTFGPPSFEQARIRVPDAERITIKLR
ncbi:DUF2141 domain-containing protein [Marinoscillum sp.]|uniref:DUF2141 domain-containing protein n=1 Tax=Marinoscillum sp. TaxID=2024838 RepID=UPI003BAA680E